MGYRYGFVRFLRLKNDRLLETQLDSIMFRDTKLHANMPHFKKGYGWASGAGRTVGNGVGGSHLKQVPSVLCFKYAEARRNKNNLHEKARDVVGMSGVQSQWRPKQLKGMSARKEA